MRTLKKPITLLALLSLGLLSVTALQAEVTAIRASKIFTGAGAPIENGVILINGDKITDVGQKVSIPAGAKVIEVKGVVTPGWINAGSTEGIQGRLAEEVEEVTPEIRVLDSLDLDSRNFKSALKEGITTVAISPGERNVIGGLGAIVRTKPQSLRKMVVNDQAFLSVSMVLSAAYSNRSMRGAAPYSIYYRIPTTRMGTVFLIRRAFTEAKTYSDSKKITLPQIGSLTPFLSQEGRDILLACTQGKRKVRIRADYKQEIRSAIMMAKEFGLSLTIEGALEAAQLIPEIKESKTQLLIRPGAYFETFSKEDPSQFLDLPKALTKAKIPFAFSTTNWGSSASLRTGLRMDVRFGLSENDAINAVTSQAAKILGIDSKVGSIAKGKNADLVAFTDSPFSITSQVDWVMVDGKVQND